MLLAPKVYLTDSQLEATRPSYRFFVELASNALDFEGVPERYLLVDVVVALPCEAAARQLLDDRGWLAEWGIVSVWIPQEEAPF